MFRCVWLVRAALPFLLLLPALAASATDPPATPAVTIVKADRMLDMVSGELRSDVAVVVRDGLIEAIDPSQLPAGEVVELGDLTLLPGLMDLHTHLTFDMSGDWLHRPVKETAADFALRGARNARVTLLAGFTTVRDVGSSGFADVALARAIENGFVPGPRMFAAGHSLGITGGHCDATGYAPGVAEGSYRNGLADGVAEVTKAVRYQIKHGARVIKVCATAGVLSFEGPVGAQQYSLEELRAAVEEAARHGMKVAAHAHGEVGIRAAIEAGVASIEHGSELGEETLALMKERGTFLVPTTYLADAIDLDALPPHIRAKAESILPVAKDSLRRAIQAGVKIAYGTDAAVYPHGLNARELGSLVDRGMTPLEALRSATVHAAELLGVEDRGVVAPGKLADLIAVAGNPLEDIRSTEEVRFVMKAGVVFKAP